MKAPFQNLNADSLESVDLFCGENPNLGHLVPLTLLKVRLLLDLLRLRFSETPEIAGKVPREILGTIQKHTLSTNIVLGNKKLQRSEKLEERIGALYEQIAMLWKTVDKACNCIWELFFMAYPEDLKARPPSYAKGNIGKAQLVLRYNFGVWRDSPGVDEIIGTLEDSEVFDS